MESIDKYNNLIDNQFEIPTIDMKDVEERISNIENEEERDNAREHMMNSLNDVVCVSVVQSRSFKSNADHKVVSTWLVYSSLARMDNGKYSVLCMGC